eukprot:7032074-Alexandrium_andersonii.AAC.1
MTAIGSKRKHKQLCFAGRGRKRAQEKHPCERTRVVWPYLASAKPDQLEPRQWFDNVCLRAR